MALFDDARVFLPWLLAQPSTDPRLVPYVKDPLRGLARVVHALAGGTPMSAGLVLHRRGPSGPEILLGHPTRAPWSGSYSIPKGGIDPNEDPVDAAIRETREEVGIVIDPSRLTAFGVVENRREGKVKKYLLYWRVDVTGLGFPDVLPTRQLQLAEIDWAGFLPVDTALGKVTAYQSDLVTSIVSSPPAPQPSSPPSKATRGVQGKLIVEARAGRPAPPEGARIFVQGATALEAGKVLRVTRKPGGWTASVRLASGRERGLTSDETTPWGVVT